MIWDSKIGRWLGSHPSVFVVFAFVLGTITGRGRYGEGWPFSIGSGLVVALLTYLIPVRCIMLPILRQRENQ